MQLAYQLPILQQAIWNGNFTSDWLRVPVGSSLRPLVRVPAIVGAPAATLLLQLMNTNGDPVTIWTQAIAAVGEWSSTHLCSTEFLRIAFTQAGGAANVTISVDLIVSPPDSTPA